MTPETADRLLTGEAYLESLRDGREVWIDGERVSDVTTHPAFRNAARSVAALYDAMHDPEQRDVLGLTRRRWAHHAPVLPPLLHLRGPAGLARGDRGVVADVVWVHGAHAGLQGLVHGQSGRGPGLVCAFGDSARTWYRTYAEQALFLNHVLVNPPIDRGKAVHEVEDVYVHVVQERDDGMVVRGAKMLATGSALTHATFVAQNSAVELKAGKAEDYALCFIAPMSSPGVKLVSRASYELSARSPFDAPLSSRFDENDAVVVFDDVLIPWEDVLVYRDVKRDRVLRPVGVHAPLHLPIGNPAGGRARLPVRAVAAGLQTNGTSGFRGVQAAIGELMGWRNLIWSMTSTLCHETSRAPAQRDPGDRVRGPHPQVRDPGLRPRPPDLHRAARRGAARHPLSIATG